jgi:hypothetical protein
MNLGPQFANEARLDVKDYEGQVNNRDHITRSEEGVIPTTAVANLMGVKGEVPGKPRYPHWPELRDDIARNGIQRPIFITVDWGEEPKISEGNHRRDAAVELGHSHVPVEIRYFGHAERQGSVHER